MQSDIVLILKRLQNSEFGATSILKEFITKGFVLDDDLLKNGTRFGKDYFDELIERIKEIRVSKRRFYQKITDLYRDCSYDYDKKIGDNQIILCKSSK